jgi:phenylalanyl-tRNA synthetase beta chain
LDILIQDSWLREYLDTPATPKQIQECLSLCGPSVERIEEIDGETVYHIEVTTNRVDAASIMGLAREATAILPRFNIPATFKPYEPKSIKEMDNLSIEIVDKNNVCHRILGVVMDCVTIGKSPEYLTKRLENTGIRSLNNIVDVTNLVMTEIGHPAHVFDYDRLTTKKLILRKSKPGEKIISLEGKEYTLNGGDIVIDDGTGKIIDLPGIIGTENSIVVENTKRILFFIETNDPILIRKTSMSLGIRTVAATLNEKGVDPNLAKTAFLRGIELFEKNCGGKIASKIYDLYPNPIKTKTVICPLKKLYEYADEKIDKQEILRILNSLEIPSKIENEQIISEIPTFRNRDLEIPEDIIEEIIRIYGYFNLKGKIPTGDLPQIVSINVKNPLKIEKVIKEILVNLGMTEVYTLSMIAEEDTEQLNLSREKLVKISNPLNANEYIMRPSLYPSLKKVIEENSKREEKIILFEMANTYTWIIEHETENNNNLPKEKLMLGIIASGYTYFELKGKLEYFFKELGINPTPYLNFPNNKILYVEYEVESLVNNFSYQKKLVPVPKFPEAYEDLALSNPKKIFFEKIIEEIKKQSSLINRVELLDEYENFQTLRVIYQSDERNIEGAEIQPIRENILNELKNKFNIVLKT